MEGLEILFVYSIVCSSQSAMLLPGHSVSIHFIVSVFSPSHLSPPREGGGLLHSLARVFTPSPHEEEQVVQELQGLNFPSTVNGGNGLIIPFRLKKKSAFFSRAKKSQPIKSRSKFWSLTKIPIEILVRNKIVGRKFSPKPKINSISAVFFNRYWLTREGY